MTRRRLAPAAALRSAFGFAASAVVLWLILRFIARNGGAPPLTAFEPAWALGAIAASTLQIAVVAGRWAFFTRELAAPLDYPAALGAYYVSAFLNQLLPLGVLGDAARGVWHARRLSAAAVNASAAAREGSPAVDAATALVLDRASGQLALLLLVLPILPLWWQPLGAGMRSFAREPRAGVLLGASCCVLAVVALCVYFWRSLLRHTARARRLFFLPRSLATHGAYSVASVCALISAYYCAARALGFALRFGLTVRVVPLVLLASALPSFALGTGAREVAAAALYHALGLRSAEGAAVALGVGLLGFVASFPGVVVLVLARRRARALLSVRRRAP